MDRRLLYPRHWPSWLLVGACCLIGLLPFPLLWALGMGIGYLGYFLAGTRRRVALRNLARCFPDLTDRAQRKLTALHFGYLGVAACYPGRTAERWLGEGSPELEICVQIAGHMRDVRDQVRDEAQILDPRLHVPSQGLLLYRLCEAPAGQGGSSGQLA